MNINILQKEVKICGDGGSILGQENIKYAIIDGITYINVTDKPIQGVLDGETIIIPTCGHVITSKLEKEKVKFRHGLEFFQEKHVVETYELYFVSSCLALGNKDKTVVISSKSVAEAIPGVCALIFKENDEVNLNHFIICLDPIQKADLLKKAEETDCNCTEWLYNGYDIFEADYMNGALHIECINSVHKFSSDEEAAVQAEKDGIKLIHDLPIPDTDDDFGYYIDTAKNRQIIKEHLASRGIKWEN